MRETKGTDDIEKLQWESEGWKIKFGEAHFEALEVDYAFGDDPESLIVPSTAVVLRFPVGKRLVGPDDLEPRARFATHLPVYSLEAAAGYFGAGRDVEIEGWVEVAGRLDETMFVSLVRGRSMEPRISDRSLCVFRRVRPGTRKGKIVLAQHRDIEDPDTGGSFTVKVYDSTKVLEDDEVRGSVALRPLNPDFEAIVIDAEDDAVTVIAEFVEVLGTSWDVG